MDETILTVESWHGLRTWRRVGLRDHVTRDGRKTKLAVWEGACTICGATFSVAAPVSVFSSQGSKSFSMATCPAHRLTPTEAAKIRFAKKDDRLTVFEGIKKQRLSHDGRSSTEPSTDPQNDFNRLQPPYDQAATTPPLTPPSG
jgi:hypothetical protein